MQPAVLVGGERVEGTARHGAHLDRLQPVAKGVPSTLALCACARVRARACACVRARVRVCVLCACMCTGVCLQPGDAKRCLLALLVPVPQPAALPRTPREERAIRRDGEGVRGAGHDCGHLEARQGGHLVSTRGKHAVCVCERERERCVVFYQDQSLSLSLTRW
jgi:hypothetical protein